MGKNLSIIIDTFLLIVALIVVPLILVTQKEEKLAQPAIETIVTEFVDNSRGTGRINYSEYQTMYSDVGILCESAVIQLKHSSKMAASNGTTVEDYYIDFNNEEILDVIYNTDPNGYTDYKLRNGDKLEVIVRNGQPTKATRLLRLIFPNAADTSIYYKYSGTVGNNAEE